jgi:hypothetical protein
MKDDGALTSRNQLSRDDGLTTELWERVHDNDLTVSIREIGPRRFQIAAFLPDRQQWVEIGAETAAEAKRLGDAFVQETLRHTCTATCRAWVLSDLAAADWAGSDEPLSATDSRGTCQDRTSREV